MFLISRTLRRLLLAAAPLVVMACEVLPGGVSGPTPTAFPGVPNEPGSATPTPMPAFFGQPYVPDTGRTFIAQSWLENGADMPFADDTEFRLFLWDDGSLGARTGCGGFSAATYSIEDGFLRLTEVERSRNLSEDACGNTRAAQDDWIARFLTAAPTFDLNGQTLVLAAGVSVITFAELIEPPPTPRIRFVGILDRASQGGDEINVPGGLTASVTFLDDGSVSWEIGDCGSGGATYVGVDNHTINFTDTTTNSSCKGNTAAVEEAVTSVFSSTGVEYAVEGSLSLTATDTQLVFSDTSED